MPDRCTTATTCVYLSMRTVATCQLKNRRVFRVLTLFTLMGIATRCAFIHCVKRVLQRRSIICKRTSIPREAVYSSYPSFFLCKPAHRAHPKFKAHKRTVESLPGIKEYLSLLKTHTALQCKTRRIAQRLQKKTTCDLTSKALPRTRNRARQPPPHCSCRIAAGHLLRRRARSCEPRDPSQTRGSGRPG